MNKRRRSLVIGGGALAVGAAAEITLRLPLTELIKSLLSEKRPQPKPYPPYQSFLEKLGPFPKKAPLKARVKRATIDGKKFINTIETDATKLLAIEGVDEHDLQIAPFDSNNKDQISRMLNLRSHLVEAQASRAVELREAAVSYLTQNSSPEAHDAAEPHVMSIIAELMGEEGEHIDERLRTIINARFKKGLSTKSGGETKRSKVEHRIPGLDIPTMEELSWVMLVAARTDMAYEEKSITIRHNSEKIIEIGPEELIKIAAYYCDLIAKKKHYEGKLTEVGCHAVHGAIVLLGKYRQYMPPEQAENLATTIRKSLIQIMTFAKLEENEYIYGGHLLQAILDPNAAALFQLEDDGETISGYTAFAQHYQEIAEEADKNPVGACKIDTQTDNQALEVLKWQACELEHGQTSDILEGRSLEQIRDAIKSIIEESPLTPEIEETIQATRGKFIDMALGGQIEISDIQLLGWIASYTASDIGVPLKMATDKSPSRELIMVSHTIGALQTLSKITQGS